MPLRCAALVVTHPPFHDVNLQLDVGSRLLETTTTIPVVSLWFHGKSLTSNACIPELIVIQASIYQHPITMTHRTWGWTAYGPPQLKMLRMVKRKAGWYSARDPEGCSILQTPPSDVARSTKRHVLETGWAYEIDWIYCMHVLQWSSTHREQQQWFNIVRSLVWQISQPV